VVIRAERGVQLATLHAANTKGTNTLMQAVEYLST